MAQDLQAVLVAQLTEQGFSKIQIGRTFLGRVRLFATSANQSREIIFNPRTGEILRDYWDNLDDTAPASARLSSSRSGSSKPSHPAVNDAKTDDNDDQNDSNDDNDDNDSKDDEDSKDDND